MFKLILAFLVLNNVSETEETKVYWLDSYTFRSETGCLLAGTTSIRAEDTEVAIMLEDAGYTIITAYFSCEKE
jgi:hypothetical protein